MARIDRLLDRLEAFYGPLKPPPRDPFALFVWEVLSVHAAPARREAALAALKRMRALTPDAMWRAPRGPLETAVRLAGSYVEQRLRALRTGVDLFRRTPGLPTVLRGPLPAARRALEPFPVLGETGSRRLLLFAADRRTLPVDAPLCRTALRLGYGLETGDVRRTMRAVRRVLTDELAPGVEACRRAALYLSHHGAATCTDASPHCQVCPLADDCPEGGRRVAAGGPARVS